MQRLVIAAALVAACSSGDDSSVDATPPGLTFTAVSFNTGTSADMAHNSPPDDGYTDADAQLSDMFYGDGLAWVPAVEATRAYFATQQPDIVGFQEIFHSDECASIPAKAHGQFVCATWGDGDATVAQVVLGAGYQVACHLGKPDKCLGVRRAFGTFRGCDGDLCLDGLAGAPVPDCGSGSRIGRGVIDLVDGGELTVVNIHGTSGLGAGDVACRVAQFEQVFLDLDGAPAANGAANVVLGDLNTDPGRFAGQDASAARFADFVGDDKAFAFVTDVGPDAVPTYQGVVNIDHIVSDRFIGSCVTAGVTAGVPDVIDATYFDHKPVLCTLAGDL